MMIALDNSDFGSLDEVDIVVAAIREVVDINGDDIMLVGASCRDFLHASLGHEYFIGETRDLDLGLVLSDWSAYIQLDQAFRRVTDSGIAYRIEGITVDVLPFGGIEDPIGIATPASRGESLVVRGFEPVHARSNRLDLPNAGVICVPEPAGYTALKMWAWLERSVVGEYKDARDLAVAMHWYQNSGDIMSRLYETDVGLALLDAYDWEPDVAALAVLGQDVREQLGDQAVVLAESWGELDVALLARYLRLPPTVRWEPDRDRRVRLISALGEGLDNGRPPESRA